MLSKVNIWKFRVLDGAGKAVETAPGSTTITIKGPASKSEAVKAANLLLDSKRADAVRAGIDDPGYKLDEASMEAVGHTDGDVGFWSPAEAKSLDLPTDATVREQHRRVIRENVDA